MAPTNKKHPQRRKARAQSTPVALEAPTLEQRIGAILEALKTLAVSARYAEVLARQEQTEEAQRLAAVLDSVSRTTWEGSTTYRAIASYLNKEALHG